MHAMKAIALSATLVVASGALPAHAQLLSPLSDFQAMPVDSLQWLQVKITFIGAQRKIIPTALFTSRGRLPDASHFAPFHRPEGQYSNDEDVLYAFGATLQELKAIIDGVATVPEVADGGVDPGSLISFALQNFYGGTSKVFESLLNGVHGEMLYDKLLTALAANDSGRAGLTAHACGLGMMPGSPPGDVSGSVQTRLQGLRFDRKAGHFVGRLQVTNTSPATIVGPVIAAIVIKGGASLINADGHTSCLVPPFGTPFITLPVGGGLGPSQSVQVKLVFDNPWFDTIVLKSVRVLAGPGTR